MGTVNTIVFISAQPGHPNYPPAYGKPCIPVTCENSATTDSVLNVRIGSSELLDVYPDSEHCVVKGLSWRRQIYLLSNFLLIAFCVGEHSVQMKLVRSEKEDEEEK